MAEISMALPTDKLRSHNTTFGRKFLRPKVAKIGTLGNSKKRMATQSIPKAMLINSDEVDSKFSQQQLTIQPAPQSNILAYELVQGALVKWNVSNDDTSTTSPPTAVFLHGILSGKKSWIPFAKRLAAEFPSWQFLVVDLPCHGESSYLPTAKGSHTMETAALDVYTLLQELDITPRAIIGHSFGGKVALSMVDQLPDQLPRPLKVWVMDTTPGLVKAGLDGEGHPGQLIQTLKKLPTPIASKKELISFVMDNGFPKGRALWVTNNLRKDPNSSGYLWNVELNGVGDMFDTYEVANLWPVLENVPEGIFINFLRAEKSVKRWSPEDVNKIVAAEFQSENMETGIQLHLLEGAGHGVHTDNPDGLFELLAPTFGLNGFVHR